MSLKSLVFFFEKEFVFPFQKRAHIFLPKTNKFPTSCRAVACCRRVPNLYKATVLKTTMHPNIPSFSAKKVSTSSKRDIQNDTNL